MPAGSDVDSLQHQISPVHVKNYHSCMARMAPHFTTYARMMRRLIRDRNERNETEQKRINVATLVQF